MPSAQRRAPLAVHAQDAGQAAPAEAAEPLEAVQPLREVPEQRLYVQGEVVIVEGELVVTAGHRSPPM